MSASAAAHNKLKRKRGVAEDAGPGLSAGLTRRSWSTTEVVDVDALPSATAESRNAGTQKRVRTKKGRAQAANRPEASNRPAAAVANRGTQLAGPVAPVTQGKSIASAIPISDESDEDGVWAVGRETFEPRRRAKRAPPVTDTGGAPPSSARNSVKGQADLNGVPIVNSGHLSRRAQQLALNIENILTGEAPLSGHAGTGRASGPLIPDLIDGADAGRRGRPDRPSAVGALRDHKRGEDPQPLHIPHSSKHDPAHHLASTNIHKPFTSLEDMRDDISGVERTFAQPTTSSSNPSPSYTLMPPLSNRYSPSAPHEYDHKRSFPPLATPSAATGTSSLPLNQSLPPKPVDVGTKRAHSVLRANGLAGVERRTKRPVDLGSQSTGSHRQRLSLPSLSERIPIPPPDDDDEDMDIDAPSPTVPTFRIPPSGAQDAKLKKRSQLESTLRLLRSLQASSERPPQYGPPPPVPPLPEESPPPMPTGPVPGDRSPSLEPGEILSPVQPGSSRHVEPPPPMPLLRPAPFVPPMPLAPPPWLVRQDDPSAWPQWQHSAPPDEQLYMGHSFAPALNFGYAPFPDADAVDVRSQAPPSAAALKKSIKKQQLKRKRQDVSELYSGHGVLPRSKEHDVGVTESEHKLPMDIIDVHVAKFIAEDLLAWDVLPEQLVALGMIPELAVRALRELDAPLPPALEHVDDSDAALHTAQQTRRVALYGPSVASLTSFHTNPSTFTPPTSAPLPPSSSAASQDTSSRRAVIDTRAPAAGVPAVDPAVQNKSRTLTQTMEELRARIAVLENMKAKKRAAAAAVPSNAATPEPAPSAQTPIASAIMPAVSSSDAAAAPSSTISNDAPMDIVAAATPATTPLPPTVILPVLERISTSVATSRVGSAAPSTSPMDVDVDDVINSFLNAIPLPSTERADFVASRSHTPVHRPAKRARPLATDFEDVQRPAMLRVSTSFARLDTVVHPCIIDLSDSEADEDEPAPGPPPRSMLEEHEAKIALLKAQIAEAQAKKKLAKAATATAAKVKYNAPGHPC